MWHPYGDLTRNGSMLDRDCAANTCHDIGWDDHRWNGCASSSLPYRRLVPAVNLHMRNMRRLVGSCALNAVARSTIGHTNLQIGVRPRVRADGFCRGQHSRFIRTHQVRIAPHNDSRCSRSDFSRRVQVKGAYIQDRSFSLIAAGVSKRCKRSWCLITDR
jgi:hypothetical protein